MRTMRIGIARSGPDRLVDALIASIATVLQDQGRHVRILEDPRMEREVDTLMLIGFPAAYRHFLGAPRHAERIAWFGEPLPRTGPASFRDESGETRHPWPPMMRRAMDRVAQGSMSIARAAGRLAPGMLADGFLGPTREAAAIEHERWANLRDAQWCSMHVDHVVTTSNDRATALSERGIRVATIPFGYHPHLAGPMRAPASGHRDLGIAVLGSGWMSSRRRRGKQLAAIAGRLEPHQQPVVVDRSWGADRDALLGRSRVLLDIHRVPGNFTGIRLIIGLAAGLAVVTEPMDDPSPFVPGVHFVEAPVDRLAHTALALLADEPERQRIVEAGQALLAGQVSMRHSVGLVLPA
jgi:hypothetical protein